MDDYKPNSYKFKEAEKASADGRKPEKVVRGPVRIKKKSEARKLLDMLVHKDAEDIKNHILMDVLVPAIKKAIYDAVTDGTDMLLYGGSGKGKKKLSSHKVSYRDYYDRRDDHRYRDSRMSNRFDYDDLIFETRSETEAVRKQMEDIRDKYGFVTVQDLYDIADVSAPYTASDYGWTNIRNAEIVRVKEGYILKLPPAMPID